MDNTPLSIRVLFFLALSLGGSACAAQVDSSAPREVEETEQGLVSGAGITTLTYFDLPSGLHTNRDIALTVDVDPGPGGARYFATQAWFQNGDVVYMGLQTDTTAAQGGSIGKGAIFSLWNATAAVAGDAGSWAQPFGNEGVGYSVRMPFNWIARRKYTLRMQQVSTGWWGGYVIDTVTNTQTYLGKIQARAGTGLITGSQATFNEWYGGDFNQCSELRLSRATWGLPTAQSGSVVATGAHNSIGTGACASTRTSSGSGPVTHTLGWANVLYVGDSLAAETSDTVSQALSASARSTLTLDAFPGMAICDFLDSEANAAMPAASHLRAQVKAYKPTLVALQFWGNALTKCINAQPVGSQGYYNQYFWNAAQAANEIAAGAQDAGIARPIIVWVLQGPQYSATPLPAGTQSRTEQLNGIYKWMAAYFGDTTSDAGWLVSMAANYSGTAADRYTWTQYLPCTTQERNTPGLCTQPQSYGGVTQLHKDDDPTHFCLGSEVSWADFFTCGRNTLSPGIVRYGGRIASDVRGVLGI